MILNWSEEHQKVGMSGNRIPSDHQRAEVHVRNIRENEFFKKRRFYSSLNRKEGREMER